LKTFCFIKSVYRLLELGKIKLGANIAFLAETNAREKTIYEDEFPKFKSIYNKDIVSDFNIVFRCYQGKPYKEFNNFTDFSVVILDEVHDTLTEEYYPDLTQCEALYMIGLTGAMSLEANVFTSKVEEELKGLSQSQDYVDQGIIGDYITKGQMLEMFCPVVFKYTTKQAIEYGVIADFKSYEIHHHLTTYPKKIKIWKSYDTLGSEYDFYMKRQNLMYGNKPAYLKKAMGRQMAKFLYNLPSKTTVVKAILERLGDQKTLIFGKELDTLATITPNVVRKDNWSELIDQFNTGEINVLASSRKLKQGITLKGVQNIIFHSYDSKWHNMEQMRARVRWLDGDVAKLFFIVTQGTLETKWYIKMTEERDSKNKLIERHDFNVKEVTDSRVLVNWYKKIKND
jgi:superfamily II DNA or RNA helicase